MTSSPDRWYRALWMDGTVHIDATMPLAHVARLVAKGLGVTFAEDIEGNYEEFPAWTGAGGGLRFVLLGTPSPEDDHREVKSADYELQILSEREGYSPARRSELVAHNIEVSEYFARLLQAKTGLPCRASERPNAA